MDWSGAAQSLLLYSTTLAIAAGLLGLSAITSVKLLQSSHHLFHHACFKGTLCSCGKFCCWCFADSSLAGATDLKIGPVQARPMRLRQLAAPHSLTFADTYALPSHLCLFDAAL